MGKDIEEINVKEFLIKWRKEYNTKCAVYSSYHINSMEAFAIEYNKSQQQTIDKLTKDSGKYLLKENTKLKETIKEAHNLLHKCNSNDANVDRAIEILKQQ